MPTMILQMLIQNQLHLRKKMFLIWDEEKQIEH